jgi:anaerobic magnesium-protoporphyrin IX monomethyl ester cyclase
MGKNLDLLMLHPGSNREVYEGLDDRKLTAVQPPFTAAMLASFSRDRGYSVEILDANAENLSYEQTAERVKEINPGLIATVVDGHQPSASSQTMGAVGEVCREIKGRTDIPIILTGVHPSSLPERTLREESIDFVARGEEARTIVGLLETGFRKDSLERIPGLGYLDEGNFVLNKSAPLADLDRDFPDVAWDLLPALKNYRSHNWHAFFGDVEDRQPYGALYSSLGCPYKCSFCMINGAFKASIADNSLGETDDRERDGLLKVLDDTNPTIRYWNADNVIKHIDYFVEQGVKQIKFIDEMFVLNKNHVTSIADKIIERGYNENINIWAYARIDTVQDERLLDKLKSGGINWLCLGIESANKDVRHGADKKFGNTDIYKNVRRVHKAGIDIIGNYMVGLRTDTQDSMRETLEMAKNLKTLWFNIYPTMAYPGAPDYNWAKEKGIALPGDQGIPGSWTAYSHHSYNTLPLPTENLSAAEVLKFRDDAFHIYFSDPSYLSMVEHRLGEKAVEHIKDMSSHRLSRRILENDRSR